VAQTLMEHGLKNVHPLFGGFDAWKAAGLPLDDKSSGP
jgi:rhodanese-related sulfurtransferase